MLTITSTLILVALLFALFGSLLSGDKHAEYVAAIQREVAKRNGNDATIEYRNRLNRHKVAYQCDYRDSEGTWQFSVVHIHLSAFGKIETVEFLSDEKPQGPPSFLQRDV